MRSKKRNFIKPRLRAKLIFDQGFAENPVYSIKAFTNEKEKGINMIELIKSNFSINGQDISESFKKEVREVDEWNKEAQKSKGLELEADSTDSNRATIKWTRDEKGNIRSPYASKRKDTL